MSLKTLFLIAGIFCFSVRWFSDEHLYRKLQTSNQERVNKIMGMMWIVRLLDPLFVITMILYFSL
jgi:hypothetical protein